MYRFLVRAMGAYGPCVRHLCHYLCLRQRAASLRQSATETLLPGAGTRAPGVVRASVNTSGIEFAPVALGITVLTVGVAQWFAELKPDLPPGGKQ